jgi:hypothetical protein
MAVSFLFVDFRRLGEIERITTLVILCLDISFHRQTDLNVLCLSHNAASRSVLRPLQFTALTHQSESRPFKADDPLVSLLT